MKYICTVCGYIYDTDVGEKRNNIPAGTKFEDLPENFICPICGVTKDIFNEIDK